MENKTQKKNSTSVFAFILIGIGMLWILHKIGFGIHFPAFSFDNLFFPFRPVFHNVGAFIFSWQVVLIIIGLLLIAGRRTAGFVLIVIGGLFLLPEIVFFPHFTISLIIPVALIAVGVLVVARHV